MITFTKNVDKMSEGELRVELKATRKIIDDIYELTKPKNRPATLLGRDNIINQIARYCYRKMP